MRASVLTALSLSFGAFGAFGAFGDQAAGVLPDALPVWEASIETDGEQTRNGASLTPSSSGAFDTSLDEVIVTNEGQILDLAIDGNVDPFQAISAVFVDTGAASLGTLTLTTPIFPMTGTVKVTATGTVTGVDGDGTVETFSPALPGPVFFDHTLEGMSVAALGGAPLTEDGSPTAFVATGTFGCGVGGCSPMVSSFSIMGSGGGDIYQASMSLTVTRVPAPLPALLLGTALLAAFGVTRPRRA